MSVRFDRLQSISPFFPQTTSRGKQAMILKNPADDLGIRNRNHRGERGAKAICIQTLWIERYTNTKLPVSLGPLYRLHLLLARVQLFTCFTSVTILIGPTKIIVIMPSSLQAWPSSAATSTTCPSSSLRSSLALR